MWFCPWSNPCCDSYPASNINRREPSLELVSPDLTNLLFRVPGPCHPLSLVTSPQHVPHPIDVILNGTDCPGMCWIPHTCRHPRPRDGALSTDGAVGVPVHCRQWDQMAFQASFQLKPFCGSMNVCTGAEALGNIIESLNHRIIECPGLKRTTMLIYFQPPAMCSVANHQTRLSRATSSLE